MSDSETPTPEQTASATPENHGENPGLREQPHGGALRNGGTNKGGPGRPRSYIRELAMGHYEANIDRLARIAAGTETRTDVVTVNRKKIEVQIQPTFKESIEAMKELGNRGVGKMVELDIPSLPVVSACLVSPEVAAELEQKRTDDGQAA